MTALADDAPASAEEFLNRPPTPAQRIQHVLHRQPALSPAIVLVAACIAFSFLSDRFARPENLSLVAQQVAEVVRSRSDRPWSS